MKRLLSRPSKRLDGSPQAMARSPCGVRKQILATSLDGWLDGLGQWSYHHHRHHSTLCDLLFRQEEQCLYASDNKGRVDIFIIIKCDNKENDGASIQDFRLNVVSSVQNCLGALDGTFIKVHVPNEDRGRYRTRKGNLAMNVLGVCTPNMEFVFVLPGWEGSAHDGRVLRDAISRPNGLKVPQGKPCD
uniref:DDE Tnp4 domain-containing protein n=1 Tax=Chenopodium quinoa TaxID=63459 RepID=A0A803KZB5_CHEQI